MIIGLTGGIASGKTTVSRMLRCLGAEIVDADEIARSVVLPGEPVYSALVDEFGGSILNPDYTINRGRLAQLAFSSPERTQALNRITHPEIRRRIASSVAHASRCYEVIVIDAPLLFEAEMHRDVDEVWVVFAAESDQINRLGRQGYTEQQARARMAAQMPLADKAALADVVIDNRGTIQQTRQQIMVQYERITGSAGE